MNVTAEDSLDALLGQIHLPLQLEVNVENALDEEVQFPILIVEVNRVEQGMLRGLSDECGQLTRDVKKSSLKSTVPDYFNGLHFRCHQLIETHHHFVLLQRRVKLEEHAQENENLRLKIFLAVFELSGGFLGCSLFPLLPPLCSRGLFPPFGTATAATNQCPDRPANTSAAAATAPLPPPAGLFCGFAPRTTSSADLGAE